MQEVLRHITEAHGYELRTYEPLAGGDINQVFLLKCNNGELIAKLNTQGRFPQMFEKEAKGLEVLRATKSFTIPRVLATDNSDEHAYLLLEYLPPATHSATSWFAFAEDLAIMHQTSTPTYGLDHDNYIGSLPQHNASSKSASEFYIQQRLIPQFTLAETNGFSFDGLEGFYQRVEQELPNGKPSLIHGDLWNGNYMVTANNTPVLIDPAVSFSIREMDIAMMQLFGGFPAHAIQAYHENYPMEAQWEERIPLFQLYYILVHLNLFGSSYLSQVNQILRRFR